jgi:hypothetical protein
MKVKGSPSGELLDDPWLTLYWEGLGAILGLEKAYRRGNTMKPHAWLQGGQDVVGQCSILGAVTAPLLLIIEITPHTKLCG